MRDDTPAAVTLQVPRGEIGLEGLARSCVAPHNIANAVAAFPISEIDDLRIEQALVIKDLLFVMLGHEGSYIRYSDRYSPSDSRQLVVGPDFRIAKHMDISLKGIAKKLVKIGKHYCGVNAFIQLYDEPAYGKVMQRLCYEISRFLYDFHSTIEQLERQFNTDPSFTISIFENALDQTVVPRLSLLYDLVVALDQDDRSRELVRANPSHHNFSNFIENIQRDLRQTGDVNMAAETTSLSRCRGGVALNILHTQINQRNGDPQAFDFLTSIYNAIAADYVTMLNKWLRDGEVDDQFDEFFIKENNVPSVIDMNSEKYWDDLYMIRIDGLVHQFSRNDIQAKLLATGKYLNVFKQCTNINDFLGFGEHIEPIVNLHAQDLELKVERYFDRANRFMLKLLFEGMDVGQLVTGFQQAYLIDDAFTTNSFIGRTFNDLRRNKYGISTTRLTSCYREIINAGWNGEENPLSFSQNISVDSTNFFDLANEILNVQSFDAQNALQSGNATAAFKSLINRTVEAGNVSSSASDNTQYNSKSIDEYTISGINLECGLPFPLNLIFTQNFVFEYQMMFKLQMLLAYLTQQINVTWTEINCSTVWKFPGYERKVSKWLLRCRVLHKRMKDFVNQFQLYVDYDVVQPSYEELAMYLLNVTSSLEAVKLIEQRSSGGEPGHPLSDTSMYNYYNDKSHDIFEEKIKLQQSDSDTSALRMEEVTARMGSYLNGILRDSFLTNRDLITVLKSILYIIIQYNEQLVKFKKHIIMLHPVLFEQYSNDYPSKFDGARMGQQDIDDRFETLDEIVTDYYQRFNDTLSQFIYSAKAVGELENQRLLVLVERLDQCFPS